MRARHSWSISSANPGPLVRGTYRIQGVRCGREGCRCEWGELHGKAMLYRRERGAFRCMYVPYENRQRVEEGSRRHRRVRKARAAISKLNHESLALLDALREALTQPYPADDQPRTAGEASLKSTPTKRTS